MRPVDVVDAREAWRPGSAGRSIWVTLTIAALAACAGPDEPTGRSRLSLVETLAGADTAGYARALEPRPFDFPEDHGPHPDFRTEWWYLTGNLSSTNGRDFGFQFTIFRSALSPVRPETGSAWGTNQIYMAHFAVTDVERERFLVHERFARGAVGLAGATAKPLRVWLEDWVLQSTFETTFPLELRAAEEGVSLQLRLERGKPAVLQGDRGLSQKGSQPGNASYYYSHTRLPAAGTVVVGGDTLSVTGLAWLDREWSTSALEDGQVGWDWFALQVSDGWELMVYVLRGADGTPAPQSAGVLVDPSGTARPLRWGEDVTVEAAGSWRSPVDGASYPAGWRIRVPTRGWDLDVEPRVSDQELDVSFRYWEGSVSVRGTGRGGVPVQGRGYVELTGYADEGRGP